MEEKLREEISSLKKQIDELERKNKGLKRKLDQEIEVADSAMTKLAGPRIRRQVKELKRGRPKVPRPEVILSCIFFLITFFLLFFYYT